MPQPLACTLSPGQRLRHPTTENFAEYFEDLLRFVVIENA